MVMVDPISRTMDGSLFETWSQGLKERLEQRIEPRLRLLYHCDLDRVGAITHPANELTASVWHTVGRKSSLFGMPGVAGADHAPFALSDPTISREQFRFRWLADQRCFEIEPQPGAKRKLGLLRLPGSGGDAEGAELGVTEIREPMLVPPGCCIAIEDRVLLGLEVITRQRSLSDDRLGLVGESDVMWRLRDDIREVSEFRRPALIVGPTGAGKELVASAIHQHSARAERPFVTMNCAALPEHLVESLLFGHQKGAFTGADSNQSGVFRAADKGTLFMDELGEMPVAIQPKLLRTIQDGLVTAVGQHKSIEVDVRLIAATNRNLEEEVENQRMRADLYHRIAGHILKVPPLRDRRFDIPALFTHFLSGLRTEHPSLDWLWEGHKKWKRTIPLHFFVDLMRCDWTGNVRELQNIVERSARLNLHPGPFQAPELPVETLVTAAPVVATEEITASVAGPAKDADPSSQEGDNGRLATASRVLELAHKTVAKLLDRDALLTVFQQIGDGAGDDAALAQALHKSASERLFELLVEHQFKQRRVAATLEVSPSTLIKLMQRFDLPRPTDLSLETIEAALYHAGGDVATAARALKVSPQGLRKRLTVLNLKRKST